MNRALADLSRFIVTPRVAKHRVFTWLEWPSYADCQLVVFASDEDYFFGILHSRVHEVSSTHKAHRYGSVRVASGTLPGVALKHSRFPEPTSAKSATIAEAAQEVARVTATLAESC